MNFNNPNPRFTVYIHTSPSNKRYVGITSQPVCVRWGNNGKGYIDNVHFYSAIQKYGWENFSHDIVATNLSLVEASQLESDLIVEYDTMNPEHGYNHTTGGNWSTPSEDVRNKLRERTSARWRDPQYREHMCMIQRSLKHTPLSEEHKQRISNTLKGRPSPLKGRKWSPERVARVLGRVPWNKGQTAENNSSLAQISFKLRGRVFSDQVRQNMRASRKQLYSKGYAPVWINNGIVERQINMQDATRCVPNGFVIGRLPTVYVTNGETTKKISPQELSSYLEQGWTRGKSVTINHNIKSSRQQYMWQYDGYAFVSASDLAAYLNSHGYPKIVSSTITSLFNTGFGKSKMYSTLSGKISRSKINHEDT